MGLGYPSMAEVNGVDRLDDRCRIVR